MKMRLVVVLSMMIPGFFVAREAFGADATLTGDAYISSGRSTGNFGAQTNLYVGNGNTSFLQFDLSTLPAGATSGQIARATLRLYVNRVNTAGPLNVLPVTSAWSESSITFATAPTSSTSVATFEASQPGSYVTVDATTLVQGWVAAPATNFGVALASNSADVVLDSKENDQTGHAAELEITLAGPQGAMGLQGPAGAAGAAGPQGTAGPAGPQGPGGLTGPQGIVGLTGAAGPAGPQGAAGPPVSFKGAWGSGATYVVGDTVAENGTSYIALLANNNVDPATDVTNSGGHWAVLANKGTAGATGPAGAQGLMGLQGPQGNAGPQGVAGAQGPAGPDGPAGTPGAVGSQGPAGPPGAQGIPGPNGPQGAAGTAGAQGPPISFRGTWVSEVPYAVGDAVAENGTSYIALIANSDTDPATDVMNSIGNWAVLASKGDAGAAGADGAAGPQGMMGVQGVQGLPGPQGNAGADGAPGAQGIPGPNGPQGAAGTAGAQGPPVSFKGTWVSESSYNVGDTVAENGTSYIALLANSDTDPATDVLNSGGNWAVLASKGDAGAAGADGGAGPQGMMGVQGVQGLPGPQGNAGADGAPGAQGIPGPNGPQGAAGTAGAQGPPISFEGDWNIKLFYSVGDTVAENGTSYIALLANSDTDPATDVLNSGGNWAVLASKGDAGAAGADGGAGPQGMMGVQGVQGLPGPQGNAGADGAPGAQGIPGPNGPQGAAGTAGAQGPPISFRGTWVSEVPYAVGDAVAENGTSYIALIANSDTDPATDVMNSIGNWAVLASKGDAGAAGADGAAGPQGMMGVQGVQGLPGPQGNAGADGAPGAQGIPGPNGPQGAAGTAGAQGPPISFRGTWVSEVPYAVGDAVAGNGTSYIALIANSDTDPATDVMNSIGNWAVLASKGDAGAAGADGAAGPQGMMGVQGVQGLPGPQGNAGADGAPGAQGIPGPNGPQGAAGTAGAQGPPVSFKGTWVSESSYNVGDTVAENGTSYIALLANSDTDPATDVLNSGGNWAVLASKGDAGAAGADGGAGPQGMMGVQGVQGLPGPQGNAGADGAPGAQGIPGPNGPQGAAGTAGAQGPPISFEGDWNIKLFYSVGDTVAENGTSYIALLANSDTDPATDVLNSGGNWAVLASKGDAGAAGADGAPGAQGMMGAQGPQGNAGNDGAPGAQGAVGPAGPQGPVASFMGAWASGSMYAIGDAVSENGSSYVALAPNTATDPAADVASAGGNWAVLAKGAGAIPATAVMHVLSTDVYYNPLQSGQSGEAASDNTFAWVPVGCSITALQVWSRDSGDDSLIVDLQSSPNAGGSAPSDTLYSCTVSAGSPASCSTPEESPLFIPAGTFLTLNITIDGTNPPAGTGVIWTSLGCQ